ncbi:hypothetical protein G8B50_00325 [Enterococcus durans]|uniref:hypothetical protein n=1 Tax=Enterococcus durans TaxID=53345 RepID=UPI00188402C4|nr:hypothetical protein [Enterococcus durans]MBE9886156.1 hypothetical protein [Enterococcus durans]
MGEYEKDFVLRQAKDIAKALGKFVEQDSLYEIIQLDKESTSPQDKDKNAELIDKP